MPSPIFGMEFKSMTEGFFDRKKVMDKVGQATRRVLGRFGAFVRRTAKSSLRKAKISKAPGKPPNSHVGRLRELIFHAYGDRSQSVVIGPVSFGDGGVPLLLEEGGVVQGRKKRVRVNKQGRFTTSRAKSVDWVTLPAGDRKYHKFPYMKPALDKELPGLPAMWRNAVKP